MVLIRKRIGNDTNIFSKNMDDNLKERAKKIKAVALDLDGVVFTGRVLVTPEGKRMQERSRVDALGISLLRDAGIRVALITGGSSMFLNMFAKQLNSSASVKEGKWASVAALGGKKVQGKDKVALGEQWLSEIDVGWEECAFMGDDLSDYHIMQKVGLAAAPAQAEDVIKEISHFIAPRKGGDGAVRDLVNFILNAQEVDVTKLSIK